MKRSEKIELLNRIAAGETSLLKNRSKTFRITLDNKIFMAFKGKEKEITEETFKRLNGTFDIIVIEKKDIPEGVKGFIEQRTFKLESVEGLKIHTSKEVYDEIIKIEDRFEGLN